MKLFTHTLFFFLLSTQICFGQWVQVGLNGETIKDIAVQNQNIFAVTADEIPFFTSGRVLRSIDSGVNWTMIVDSSAHEVAISNEGILLLVKDWDSLYLSSDSGTTWVNSNIEVLLADSFLFSPYLHKLDVSPSGLVFCDVVSRPGDRIAMSTNGGFEWYTPGTSFRGGRSFDYKDQSILTFGQYYGPTTYDFGITLSSDNGLTWNLIRDDNPSSNYALGIGLFSNNNIMLITYGECYLSSLGDSSWTKIATLSASVGLSWTSGSVEGMLVGTNAGVFLFSDMGDSLGSRNEGLTNLNIQTLTLDNNGYVYAGTENGLWRRPLSEIVTSIDNEPTQPTEFILEQNYPNPFNPTTVISYQLPIGSDVVIRVYDVLGNEVATLVDEFKPAGKYEVEFNAASLPSGVYFYQLRAVDPSTGSGQVYVNTKKMLLLK